MCMVTRKQIVVVVALIAGIALAVPAAATGGQNSIAVSVAPINPDFLAYQKTAGETMLASSEDGGVRPSGLIPPPLDLSHIRASESRSAPMSVQEALPAAYDLRSQGRVTPVKDQGHAGSCWAFSAIASLESSLLPGETRNFAENHMKNLCSRGYPGEFDRADAEGGDRIIATAYLARWTGPVNEEDDPYDDASGVSPTDLAPEVHVQDVLFLSNLMGPNEVATLKRAIMEHGAVYTGMHMNESYPHYNPETAGYYYNGTMPANHAVTAVGWNDTYDRNLFASVPPEDGAWIIKNSWGTEFGDEGYFFLSYYDSMMGTENAVFTAEDAGICDAVYQHDPLGWAGSIGTGSETGWFAAVFAAGADEELRAVSLYTGQCDSPYELYVYLDPAAGPINTSGPAAFQSGTIGDAGYRTIPLENPVALSAGRTFSVVMNLTTPGYEYPIPVERPVPDYSSKATAEPGEGYVRINGAWVDLADEYENYSPCLKAFTVRKTPLSVTGITPDHGCQIVQVANLSGTCFRDGAVVRLTRTGQPDITATGVSVVSPSQITCTLDLTGKEAGPGDVVVENPDGQTAVLQQGFTITVPLALTVNKDAVVRGDSVTVIVSGESDHAYFVYIQAAGGTSPPEYPSIAPDQPGVSRIGTRGPWAVSNATAASCANVTTTSLGSRPVRFDTNTSTRAGNYTIEVLDWTDSSRSSSVTVSVEQGAVTITAAGSGVYSTGEEIILSGTNTDGATTYLFVTGPGLAANGVRLDDVAIPCVTGDAGTFTRVEVELDDTWEYRWDTDACGLPPGGGTFTVYAVALPGARDDLADAVYGTASVTLRGEPGPTAGFTANATAGPAPLAVRFTDASTGNLTSWNWFFGDGATSTEQHPVHTYRTPGNYTVNLTVANDAGSDSAVKTDFITATEPAGPSVLPGYNHIFVKVANDAGAKYNAFGNNTYNIRFEGINRGLNALHISTDPAVNFGQVTVSGDLSGTIYATDSGGKGYEDDIILMVAVNGTIPDDFRLHVTADGYTWTPDPLRNQAPSLDGVTYQPVSLNETFTKEDFIYGPQIWKPTGNEVEYPLYAGQNMNDTENTFRLVFIDLDAGVLRPNETLENRGAVRINYTFENLKSFAAFSVYGYCRNSNNGDDMVAWTNALTPDKAMSGYSVIGGTGLPVTAFTAEPQNGPAPLAVWFTDTSTGNPTAWNWSFGDGNTSSERNPVHTYGAPGTYTVNLTVSNTDGSATLSRPGYITVTAPKGDFGGDGEVDIGDVARVACMVVGKTAVDPAADFNGNGKVDIGDAAKIAYYFVGKVEAL